MIFGRVRSFSDIAGMHAVRMNNTAPKRMELIEKLRLAGEEPQTAGNTDYLNEGDFDLTEEDDAANEAP